ncbi:MAG TPA: class I SAM-dependent methyltransferase [Rhizomicrobium sp.]|nr:class I SAM-dependent methyltransferase [Rhizomicrobium sp.]
MTDRQRREVEYHKGYAALQSGGPVSFEVLYSPNRRWWNAYWDMWTYLTSLDLIEKRVLVVGCGDGKDAILFAKSGAKVSGFDISPDMLAVARTREKLSNVSGIDFGEMPSESLTYPDETFDLVFARDILHHVDISQTMREVTRVAKRGALFVASEVYSHSITDRIRHARWIEGWLYPRVQKIIYGNEKPYITEDERKMTEVDTGLVKSFLASISREKYFNFVVLRLISGENAPASMLDRIFLMLLGKWGGKLVAGRIVLVGNLPSR